LDIKKNAVWKGQHYAVLRRCSGEERRVIVGLAAAIT